MRPQQQGRRQRNRGGSNNNNNNNNNRRNQNPLSRSYESNGPDVKIRGNPQVIADKYTQLARDALSAGDTVMAENYFQHAEHYNRIIMAAQPPRDENRDDSRDDANDDNGDDNDNDGDEQEARNQSSGSDDDDGDNRSDNRNDERRERNNNNRRNRNNERGNREVTAETPDPVDASQAPQPVLDGTPAEVALGEASPSEEPIAKAPRKRRARKADTPAPDSDESSRQVEMVDASDA